MPTLHQVITKCLGRFTGKDIVSILILHRDYHSRANLCTWGKTTCIRVSQPHLLNGTSEATRARVSDFFPVKKSEHLYCVGLKVLQGYSSHYQGPPSVKPSKSKSKQRAPVPEFTSSDEEESLFTTLDRHHLSDQQSHNSAPYLHLQIPKAQSAGNRDLPTSPLDPYLPPTPMSSDERLDYRRSETEQPASYSAYSTHPAPSSSSKP